MRKEWLQQIGVVLLALLGFIAVYLVVWWGYTRYLKYVGRQIVEQSTPYEQEGVPGGKRVLVLGDSVAVGVGADSSQETIPGLLGSEAPELVIVNDAVSGLETRELAERILDHEEKSFDAVYIEIGGNDIIGLTSIKKVEENMRVILERATRVAPEVVLATNGNFRATPALPRGFRWVWERQARRQRALFTRLADAYGVRLYDRFTPYAELRVIDFDSVHACDRFHLNSEGYALTYQGLRPLFVEAGLIQE